MPLGTLWAEKRSRVVRFISPVLICYGLGMLFGNQPLIGFSNTVALTLCDITVALAIPLLLFSVDLRAWLRMARATVLSFSLVMVSAVAAGALAHLLFHGCLEQSAQIAGMLVGVYIGGTPNMAAVGKGLMVEPETFVLLNGADMVASFAYLLFILALAPRLLRPLVPPTCGSPDSPEGSADEPSLPPAEEGMGRSRPASVAASLALTAAIVAAGLGLRVLLPESVRDATAMLIITTLSVAASTSRRVREWKHTQPMGQLLLLVFCVAMGFTTDFVKLFSATTSIVLFTTLLLFAAVALHFALGVLLRIDRDTMIITSVAGIFGPHMVGPVALSLRNREVLVAGLASGLVGYAAGNYLGMLTAWLLS